MESRSGRLADSSANRLRVLAPSGVLRAGDDGSGDPRLRGISDRRQGQQDGTQIVFSELLGDTVVRSCEPRKLQRREYLRGRARLGRPMLDGSRLRLDRQALPLGVLLALGRPVWLSTSGSISRWAAKPIISRNRSASEVFSTRVRRFIISSVIGDSSNQVGVSNPTLPTNHR